MTKAKSSPATTLKATKGPGESTGAALARVALAPAANAAIVIGAYASKTVGSELELTALAEGLRESVSKAKDGDLSTLEAMLISQATALQTIFCVMAQRAAGQSQLRHYETFLNLALKAQSQSRATISALVDLKYPRQVAFVKQANIAHGPQQVNNGGFESGTSPGTNLASRAGENKSEQNKLLKVDHGQLGGWVDAGAATTPTRGDPAVEAVGAVHRAKNRSR